MSRPRIRRKSEFARSRGEAAYPELWPTDAWCPSLYPPGGLYIRSLGQNGNLGTFSSNLDLPTLWVVSEGQHAVDFSPGGGGTAFNTTLDMQQIPLTGTQSVWIKPRLEYNAPGSWNPGVEYITNSTNDHDNLIMCRFPSGNLLVGWYYDPTDGRMIIPITAATWDTTVWQNYVLTWKKGTGHKFYRNGVELATNATVPSTRQAGAGAFEFGAATNANGYDGMIDDVRICNTAWTQKQALQNYLLGRGGWAVKKRRTYALSVAAAPSNTGRFFQMFG